MMTKVNNPYSNVNTSLASLAKRAENVGKELMVLSFAFQNSQRDDLFEVACKAADFLRSTNGAQTPCLRELIELCDKIRGK